MQERSPDFCFQVDQVSASEAQACAAQSHQQLSHELIRLQQRVAELESQLESQPNVPANQAVDRITDGFLVIDRDWQIVYLNHYIETVVGRSRADLIGKNLWQEYPQLVNSVIYQTYQEAMTTGIPVHFEAFEQVFHRWWDIHVYPDAGGLSIFVKNIDDRKQVEAQQQSLLAELTAWQARYKIVDQVNHQILYEWNAKTDHTTWGSNTERILGYAVAEMPKTLKHWFDLIHSDDRAFIQHTVEQSLSECSDFQAEYRIRCRDGRYMWIADKCQVLLNDDGTLDRAIGFIVDITDHKHAEQTLRENEEIFRQITENIQEVFFICAADYSRIFYVNPAYESIWGRSRDSLYQNPISWLDSIHPEDRNRVVVALERQAQGEPLCQEYRIIRPDGSIRWIFDRTSLIRNQAGQIHRIAGIAEDITDRMHAQNALNELVEFNQQLVAGLQEGVIVYGQDFRYLVWNRAMEHMSGLRAAEVLGKRPLDVFPFLEETGIYRLLLRALSGETVTAPDVYFQIPETGKSGWTSAKFSPLHDTQGSIIGVIGVVHDITDHKQAEQTLKHRTEFERLLAQLSAELINLKLNEMDRYLQQGLQAIGQFANVDSVWMYLYSDDGTVAIKAYEWTAPGIVSPLDQSTTISMESFAWSIEKMRQSEPLFVADIADLPAAAAERTSAEAIGAKSCLAIPLTYQGRLIGSWGLHNFCQPMNWSADDINLFMILGTIFASAILRKQNELTNEAVIRAIPDLLIRFDRRGTYLDMVNPGQIRLVKPKHECIGKNIYDILPTDLAKERFYYLQKAFETGEMQRYEYQIKSQGETLYEEARIVVCNNQEALLIVRDIGDRKQAEHEREHAELALRQQVERAQLITEITQNIHQSLNLDQILTTTVTGIRQLLQADRVLFYSFEADRSGLVTAESVGEAWHSLLGQSLSNSCPTIETCFRSHDQTDVQVIANIHCLEPTNQCFELLSQLQAKTNLIAPVWQGPYLRGLLMAQQCAEPRQWQPIDVDLLKQLANQVAIAIHQSELYQRLQSANQQLQRLATLDGLTQVANRRRFDEYLDWQWQHHYREQLPLSLILCDVDFFKRYNDHYGHQAGDDCLKQIAQAIERSIQRSGDLIARYGGEEFVAVLPNTNLEGARHLALDIQIKVAQLKIPHACSHVNRCVTLSMGIASAVPTPNMTPQDLIANADHALYQAKSQGRNTCCVSEV